MHKDKVLCAWKDGCVNTHGGYKCKCPPGYKVSSQDFRLCEKGIGVITYHRSSCLVFPSTKNYNEEVYFEETELQYNWTMHRLTDWILSTNNFCGKTEGVNNSATCNLLFCRYSTDVKSFQQCYSFVLSDCNITLSPQCLWPSHCQLANKQQDYSRKKNRW